jgi:hypothetical protein
LKQEYGHQVNRLSRNRISHIDKQAFLVCLKAAYDATITPSNIQGGFRGAGLVPFDPQRVILTLNVKLRTPSPPLPTNNEPWQSQTPKNVNEFELQSTLIRNKYKSHFGSSPTSTTSASEHLLKGAKGVVHELALLKKENAQL